MLLLSAIAACGRIGVDLYAVTDPRSDNVDPDAAEPPPEPSDASSEPEDAGGELEDAAGEPEDAGGQPEDAGVALQDARVEDADAGGDAALADAGTSLVLRYDFSGTGATLMDRVGSAHGEILGGAQLDGSGRLAFDGTNDFVDMPNGSISRHTSVTVVAWLTWSGGPCWQRVFDFGSSSAGEGNAGNATSALSLSPGSCPNGVVTALFELGGDLRAVNGPALTVGSSAQVALVMDGARGAVSLYVNGARAAESPVPWRLDQLDDVNNWLGRSQWTQDRFFHGSLDEFRIYSSALSAEEIAALYARGANTP